MERYPAEVEQEIQKHEELRLRLDRITALLSTQNEGVPLSELLIHSELASEMKPHHVRHAIELGMEDGTLDIRGLDVRICAVEQQNPTEKER